MKSFPSESIGIEAHRAPSWLVHMAVALVVSVVVVALASVALFRENERYRERAIVSTQNIAVLLEQHISDVFEKIDVILRSEAQHYSEISESKKIDADTLNRHILDQEKLIPELDGLRILDAKGLVRYGNNVPTSPFVDLSGSAFYIEARDNPDDQLIVSGPLFARIAQKWVIVLARRITRTDGSFAGVVYANMEARYFEHILSSPILGKDGAATIRKEDMALVYRHPAPQNAIGNKSVSKQLAEAIQASPDKGSYIALTAMDGIERSNSYRKLKHYPFYVIVGLAVNDFLGGWKQIVWMVSGLAGLTILVTGFAANRIYRYHHRLIDDITERIRISGELEQAIVECTRLNSELEIRAHEAEIANRAKTAFLSVVSHELRTPMNAIMGLTGIALRRATDLKQQDQLTKVVQSADNLLALINGILDYTEMESNRFVMGKVDFTLKSLMDAITDKYAPIAMEKGLYFTVEVAPDLANSRFQGDAKRLGHVLQNLVSNAIKFTTIGKVTVKAQVVGGDASDVLIRFDVIDTGIGLSPEEQTRLFNVFEQIGGSLTRKYGGIGLGLALSQRLVKAMDGSIGLESDEGKGSRFWFTTRLCKASGSPERLMEADHLDDEASKIIDR